MRGHFWHSGPNGRHKCMVFEVMGPGLSYNNNNSNNSIMNNELIIIVIIILIIINIPITNTMF